jgi:hypothetical protein
MPYVYYCATYAPGPVHERRLRHHMFLIIPLICFLFLRRPLRKRHRFPIKLLLDAMKAGAGEKPHSHVCDSTCFVFYNLRQLRQIVCLLSRSLVHLPCVGVTISMDGNSSVTNCANMRRCRWHTRLITFNSHSTNSIPLQRRLKSDL